MHAKQVAAIVLANTSVVFGYPSGLHQACDGGVLPCGDNLAIAVATSEPAAIVPSAALVHEFVGEESISIASGSYSYHGDYTNFPPSSAWLPYDTLYQGVRPSMIQAGDTPGAADRVRDSVAEISSEFGIDPRVVLAICMAESHGYVGIGDAADGQPTPGLMQCWNCPAFPGQGDLGRAGIDAMVRCGVTHFKGDLDGRAGGAYEKMIYEGLRSYNSGPGGVIPGDLSSSPTGTPAYVEYVAKYLIGARTS